MIITTKIKTQKDSQLQVTGFEGAEGNFHMVFLNSGEVKRVLIGSLAGPESPNPWSHKIKLRAMGSGFGENVRDWRNSRKKMELAKVIVMRAIGVFDCVIRFIACLPRRLSAFLGRIGKMTHNGLQFFQN